MTTRITEHPAAPQGDVGAGVANETKPYHVIVSDPVPMDALLALQGVARITMRDDYSREELTEALRDADALIVRSGTRVTADLIAHADRLRIIGRAGAGVDNIDVRAATEKGVIVVNSPEGNTISAAEHTLALVLALMRHIPRACESFRRGEWKRAKFTGSELYGKTVGVVGLGKIGREVAARLRAFKARVLGSDPFITMEHSHKLEIELVDLDTLLREVDLVTVHAPLTPQTRGLIGKVQLESMKKGARIVNCARGGIIDEDALYEALVSGHLAGAAVDVFNQEPPTDRRLVELDQVVATPHLGASTEEAQVKVAVDVAEQVRDVLMGKPARAPVNIPSLPAEQLSILEPYVRLGERMGSFVAQLLQGAVQKVDISYGGELCSLRLEPVSASILKGILSVVHCEAVNFVNAPFIAQQRGIEVTESRHNHPRDYVNLVSLQVTTETEKRCCEGTLYGAREPRIVSVDGHRMDVIPVGHKLVTWQRDMPGVVGRIGSFLGDHNINIAEMQMGRESPRGSALMVLSVDDVVGSELLDRIRGLSDIRDARVVTLG